MNLFARLFIGKSNVVCCTYSRIESKHCATTQKRCRRCALPAHCKGATAIRRGSACSHIRLVKHCAPELGIRRARHALKSRIARSAVQFVLSPMLRIHPARPMIPNMQPRTTAKLCPSRVNKPAIISMTAAKTMIDALMAFILRCDRLWWAMPAHGYLTPVLVTSPQDQSGKVLTRNN